MPTAELRAARRPRSPHLGLRLERDRLEHRARRLQEAILALEARRRYRHERGSVPVPLVQAIDGFRQELRRTEQRLRTLSH